MISWSTVSVPECVCRALFGLCLAASASCHKHPGTAASMTQTAQAWALPTTLAEVPISLLASGCFTSNLGYAANLHLYQVNAPLWADGGDKARWLALSPNTSATFDDDGLLVMPQGSGIFKEFSQDGVRLETRLIFVDKAGVTPAVSWAWNDAQDDAVLVTAGESLTIDHQAWNFPGQA